MQIVMDDVLHRTHWALLDAACRLHPGFVRGLLGQWVWVDREAAPSDVELLSWYHANYAEDAEAIIKFEQAREAKRRG